MQSFSKKNECATGARSCFLFDTSEGNLYIAPQKVYIRPNSSARISLKIANKISKDKKKLPAPDIVIYQGGIISNDL
jgi:hypothetical protein